MILILFNSLLNNDMFFEEATDETDFEIRFQDQIECTKKVLKAKRINHLSLTSTPFGLFFFLFSSFLSVLFFSFFFFIGFFFAYTTFEFTKIEKFCIPFG